MPHTLQVHKGRYERRTQLVSSVNTALYTECCNLRRELGKKIGFQYLASTCSVIDILNLVDNMQTRDDALALNSWLHAEYARERQNMERYYKVCPLQLSTAPRTANY